MKEFLAAHPSFLPLVLKAFASQAALMSAANSHWIDQLFSSVLTMYSRLFDPHRLTQTDPKRPDDSRYADGSYTNGKCSPESLLVAEVEGLIMDV